MRHKYETFVCKGEAELRSDLNGRAEKGWRIHTILADWGAQARGEAEDDYYTVVMFREVEDAGDANE